MDPSVPSSTAPSHHHHGNFRSAARFFDFLRHSSNEGRSSPLGAAGEENAASARTSPQRGAVSALAAIGASNADNDSTWTSAYAKCYARRQEKLKRNEKAMANIQGKIPKAEQLFKAIQRGNVETVRDLTRKGGVDVNARFVGGSHPLATAVVCSQKEIVKWLVEQGADCNKKDGTGTTPLHLSVQWNWVSDSVIIDFLLGGDADPNVFNDHGETPLHSAIKRHRRAHVLKFLARGGNPNKGLNFSGKSPAMLAAESGQLDVLRTLIETYRADLSLRDRTGNTILHHAVLSGHAPVVEYLLENGIEPNVTNGEKVTPIKISVAKGYTSIVSLLLSHGAGISLQHRQLLDSAAKCRNSEILHLLFLHGAKSSSELVFSTLEESLVNYANSETWIPVFQNLVQATGCLEVNDVNDDILYRASLKTSEFISSAAATSAPNGDTAGGGVVLAPLAKILLMIAIGGYTFNTRILNAARVEGDPFDQAHSRRLSGDRLLPGDYAIHHDAAATRDVEREDEFPFPSLYRSLLYLQFENPRTLKEIACLSIRHCASHISNVFHFSDQLPLPKVIQRNVIDLCESLLLN